MLNNLNCKIKINKRLTFLLNIFLFLSVAFSLLSGCKKTTRYLIATESDFAPFCFINDGKLMGIDIDIMNAIAENQHIDFEFVNYNFAGAIAALQSNQVDAVMAGMSITNERKKSYDFSNPYYNSKLVAATTSSNKKELKNINDIKGKKIAVKTSSEGSRYVESIRDKLELLVSYFDDSPTMYEQVKAGNSEICFEDDIVMEYGISQGNGLFVCLTLDNTSSCGVAVSKNNNSEFLEKFNAGLDNIKQNGKYNQILSKYGIS